MTPMRTDAADSVLEPIETVLSKTFLDKAVGELRATGFVTDEHAFAPYRETITHYVAEIRHALAARGVSMDLRAGFVANHPDAGYAYFIYDASRFASLDAAQSAVSAWLSALYEDNKNA